MSRTASYRCACPAAARAAAPLSSPWRRASRCCCGTRSPRSPRSSTSPTTLRGRVRSTPRRRQSRGCGGICVGSARAIGSREQVGSKPMADSLTRDEIQSRFDSEWVLLEDPQLNEYQEVIGGKVLWHSKDRDE